MQSSGRVAISVAAPDGAVRQRTGAAGGESVDVAVDAAKSGTTGPGAGRAGDRPRRQRAARARRPPRGVEPRPDRQGGGPRALDRAAHRRRARAGRFRRRGAAGPRGAHRARPGAHRRFAELQLSSRSCARIWSRCATRSARPSISRSFPAARRCSSTRSRDSSGWSRSPALASAFPLHCTANGKAILACFAKEDAAQLIDKSVAEHPDYPIDDRAKLVQRDRGGSAQASGLRSRRTRRRHQRGRRRGARCCSAARSPSRSPRPRHRFVEQRERLTHAALQFREKLKAVVGR